MNNDVSLTKLLRRTRPTHRYVATWSTPAGPQFSILFDKSLRQARARAAEALGQPGAGGEEKVWTHATAVSVKFETSKHNIPALEEAVRHPILRSDDGEFGSIRTTLGDEARVAGARLAEHLGCEVVVEKCGEIAGDHDWKHFRLPRKHHAAARAYLAGWNQGRVDGLDLNYGRAIYASRLDNDDKLVVLVPGRP